MARFKLIAGVDEVGRGPLAGPVVASAVILPYDNILGLQDSKALTHKKRLELASVIREKAIAVTIGSATHDEIDVLNIHHASLLAMKRAIESLDGLAEMIWIDGLFTPDEILTPMQAVVKGDVKIPVVSAASIIAKVTRDQQMLEYHEQFPEYHFDSNKGYPTKKHLLALKEFGVTPIHRKSFSPVKKILQFENLCA